MSAPEAPAVTEAQQILAGIQGLNDRLDTLTTAVNAIGASNQWLVDNVQHIFQMFGSPQFMAMLGNLNFGAMTGDGPEPAAG